MGWHASGINQCRNKEKHFRRLPASRAVSPAGGARASRGRHPTAKLQCGVKCRSRSLVEAHSGRNSYREIRVSGTIDAIVPACSISVVSSPFASLARVNGFELIFGDGF